MGLTHEEEKTVEKLARQLEQAGEEEAAQKLLERTEEEWENCQFHDDLLLTKYDPDKPLHLNVENCFDWMFSPEKYEWWSRVYKRLKNYAEESDTAEPEFNEYPTGVIRSGGDKPRPDMISPFIVQEIIDAECFGEYTDLWAHLLDFQESGDRDFLTDIFWSAVEKYGVSVLMDVGQRMYEGARKHDRTKDGVFESGDRNWEKGTPVSRAFAGAYRHLIQLTNKETDENHLAAFLCNVFFMHHTLEMIDRGLLPAELDDLPHYIPPCDSGDSEVTCSPLRTCNNIAGASDEWKKFPESRKEILRHCKKLREHGEGEAADILESWPPDKWDLSMWVELTELKDTAPFLVSAFVWDDQKEGGDYWFNVHERVWEKERGKKNSNGSVDTRCSDPWNGFMDTRENILGQCEKLRECGEGEAADILESWTPDDWKTYGGNSVFGPASGFGLTAFLRSSFTWDSTPQGGFFWEDVCSEVREKELKND